MFSDQVVVLAVGRRWYGWREDFPEVIFRARSSAEALGKVVHYFAVPELLKADITGPAGGRLLHKPVPDPDAKSYIEDARYAPTTGGLVAGC